MQSSARIHETAIVADGASLGDDVDIGPFCRIGPGVTIGAGARLVSHVSIDGRTEIGARARIHPFAVVGEPPQHAGWKGEDTRLVVGADAVVREHVTIHKGTVDGGGATRIGNGVMLMVGAHVAHDCEIGDGVTFANNATLGGHVVVEEGAFLGGLCAVHQFCRIGAFAMVGGCAAVPSDVNPFGSAVGNHASLAGLNVVGMKRRGLARADIHRVRSAVRALFEGEGAAADRLPAIEKQYGDDPYVTRIVAFVKAGSRRPLMAPSR
ncbi:MAG: acyl-ACP--UDP-N-acetylglucosamine O-acyltransferase [Parvularculaceae bacterium]